MDNGEVGLPPDKETLLERIRQAADSRHGCFDVFSCKRDMTPFTEAKRRGRNRTRDTQKRWLTAAIDGGGPLESLLIAEWSLDDERTATWSERYPQPLSPPPSAPQRSRV